jgi:hypothetical protein
MGFREALHKSNTVIPAAAGIPFPGSGEGRMGESNQRKKWIPDFSGMTCAEFP